MKSGWVWWLVSVGMMLLVGCDQVTSLVATPTATMIVPTATTAPLPTATPVPAPYTVAGFEALVRELEGTRLAARQGIVNRYLAGLQRAPLLTDREALFVWQGGGFRVQLVGDMNNWSLDEGDDFQRVEGTDLWYLRLSLPAEARLDYKIVVNEREWLLDPLNGRTVQGGFGPNSEVVMPGYEPLPPVTAGVPQGELATHTLDSRYLEEKRTFFVYTPAVTVSGGGGYPSLYVQDGGDYLNIVDMTARLDRWIALGEVPPLVVVFIPPIQRSVEYRANDDYVAFLAEELVPWVEAEYGTASSSVLTGVMGSSLGGLIAVYAGLRAPDTFGLVLAQSGAYRVEMKRWEALVAEGLGKGGRYYLVAGSFETAVSGDPWFGDIIAANEELTSRLQREGYTYQYEVYPQGHSWGLWRDTLKDGLNYLYGGG
ncbi:MAG TPA: alpha/beta hydrolase-fold protein [Anaerolineae bacterium]|nr:alpha/beta hydrolase-fold protein [Anaerolineae bacterium]